MTEVLDVGHRYRGVVNPAHRELGVENKLEKHGRDSDCRSVSDGVVEVLYLCYLGCVPWLR